MAVSSVMVADAGIRYGTLLAVLTITLGLGAAEEGAVIVGCRVCWMGISGITLV